VDDCCAPKVRAVDADPGHEELIAWWREPALRLPALSGVMLAAALVLEYLLGAPTAALAANWVALISGAATFVPGALHRLARGRLGVGLLMTIATVGAVALGHIGEAAALAFLFSIAEALEERAMDRAQHGLRALLALIPSTARVLRAGATAGAAGSATSGATSGREEQEEVIAAVEVRAGDVLLVAAGERVATDGVVIAGRSGVDTSAVTGESIPIEVDVNDEVLAGSINGSGVLRLRATADGRDNSLTQIVRLVEEAHARKGERARLADRIAKPLVPGVLVLAALVAAYGLIAGDPVMWLERALVVLVAASPCALAIAVPVTVISAIGSASKLGVVIKSGEAFEAFGTVRRVFLDKTGTLTRNSPQVVQVDLADGFTRDEVLQAAAAVEGASTHPLAQAVLAAASRRRGRAGTGAAPFAGTSAVAPTASGPAAHGVHGVDNGPDVQGVEDVQEHPGRGISGTWQGRAVRVGSTRWIAPGPLESAVGQMAAAGMSVVVVELDASVAGVLGIRDELRPEAVEAVAMLRERGLEVAMLTGDDARTAMALAAQTYITDVRAEQMPADKARVVAEATTGSIGRGGAPTAMVGDGINDAPALASATVGIAMGVTGSAAAVESADVAFTGNDLRLLPRAFDHARRGRAIMTANIAFALAIVVVLVPLAMFGVLGLAAVVLVHEVAEVLVIGNGVRAARIQRDKRRGRARRGGAGPAPSATSAASTSSTSSTSLVSSTSPVATDHREQAEPAGQVLAPQRSAQGCPTDARQPSPAASAASVASASRGPSPSTR